MNTKKFDYTSDELALLDYVEKQNPTSIANVAEEVRRYRKIFKENSTARKAVSLRLLERDLCKIRTKALVLGIPYQTLIGSIIHQYAKGDLVGKEGEP